MEIFLLIDLNNYFSRFYYANKDNCVERYLKMVKESISEFGPRCLCNLIDGPISFRKTKYPNYKAQRPEKPKDFYVLLDNLKYNLKQFKYPYLSSKSLEAEDIANLFVQNLPNFEYVILSNDKDLLQLKSGNVHIFDYFNRKDNEGKFQSFVEKSYSEFCVNSTEEFKLYLALRGDSSDNIPGVNKVGDKGAVEVATGFGNYEKLLEVVENQTFLGKTKEDKTMRKIKNDLENFKLSYELVCLFDEKYSFDMSKYKI